jgi:DNA processing protein
MRIPPEAMAYDAADASVARGERGASQAERVLRGGAERVLRAWDEAEEPRREAARARVRTLAAIGVRLVVEFADDYPSGLLDLPDAPRVLCVRGSALPARERTVAIVGSRAASPYGLMHAARLASDLARLGYAIVSGFARGIDAAAHRGALEAEGSTIAVLPGTLDRAVPATHPELERAIAAHGALVSERVWPIPLFPRAFIERNRLIAALACATVVVEASERSGALHTARAARVLGRAVLAVPGDLDRPNTRGCHALLRAGAAPCTGAADVLEAVRGASRSRAPRRPRSSAPSPAAPVTTSEARVLAALAAAPRTAETIARLAGVTLAEALAALLALEWSGAARSLPGSRWVRRGGPA